MEVDCPWEYTWENQVPLDEVMDKVKAHVREAHSGE
jgi:predicted small metal-binding protein